MRSTNVKFLIFLLLVFTAQRAVSCINEYRALRTGEIIYSDAGGFGNAAPKGRFDINDKASLFKGLHEAESIYKATGRIEDYSDLGSMLVYNGRYLEAKRIFREIESRSPGLYTTAANLGTTYELLGQNDSAYFWINKAILINPNSHKGSEWIHLKILEAKINAKGDEKYLWTHSILGLDFGNDKIPENVHNSDLNKLQGHLYEQLRERMSFIKPRDPVVGQLLFDLGNVSAIVNDATSGLQIYEAASEYGYSSALFEKRYSYFKSLQVLADFRNNTEGLAKENPLVALTVIVLLFIGIVAGFVVLFRRYKKRKSRHSSIPGTEKTVAS